MRRKATALGLVLLAVLVVFGEDLLMQYHHSTMNESAKLWHIPRPTLPDDGLLPLFVFVKESLVLFLALLAFAMVLDGAGRFPFVHSLMRTDWLLLFGMAMISLLGLIIQLGYEQQLGIFAHLSEWSKASEHLSVVSEMALMILACVGIFNSPEFR